MGMEQPMVFPIHGEGETVDAYLCRLCGVLYEDDRGNVCAKKLAAKVSFRDC